MILLAIENIIDRKRVEEKLKIYAAKLERRNRELHYFVQLVSHDLQEPLRKILAFGDWLISFARLSKSKAALPVVTRSQTQSMVNGGGTFYFAILKLNGGINGH